MSLREGRFAKGRYGVALLPVRKNEVKGLVDLWLEWNEAAGKGAGTAYIFNTHTLTSSEPKKICAFSCGDLGDEFKIGSSHCLRHDQSGRDIGQGEVIDILPSESVRVSDYDRFAVFK